MSRQSREHRRALRAAHTCVVQLAIEGEALPTEFRLFKSGWNDTENGRFLFDTKAAKSVMAHYARWGVDLMIDLEHQSLEVEAGAPDPTARDARGWCRLELRNGELWACDVRWTPDGAQRLKDKTQRYVSPAFNSDPKTKRVVNMVNIAICGMPATHKTPALVAASRTEGAGMDPKLITQALEAIEKGDAKAALEILKGLVASAAGAESSTDGDEDGSQGDGAEGVAPPAEAETVEDPKVVDNAAPPPAKGDDSDDKDDEADEKDPKKQTERKAMRSMLRRLCGVKSMPEVLAKVEEYRAGFFALTTERAAIARDRAALDSAERVRLCAELVTLGAEFPATVWADDEAKTLKPRWLKMGMVELRSHVVDQRAARGKKEPTQKSGIKPPVGSASPVQLTADELRICEQMNCKPEDFAALKAQRDGVKR